MAFKVTDSIDLNNTSLLNAVLHPVTATPSAPVAGQVWYRSDLFELHFFNGTVSGPVAPAASAVAILAALLTVDGTGTGLDADLLDGVEGAAYATVAQVAIDIQASKDSILGGAGAAYDSLIELQVELQNNDTDIAALLLAQSGKADKFAVDIGDGVAVSIPVTHNLGNTDVIVQVKDVASQDVVLADVNTTSVNMVTLGFAVAPTVGQLRVVVIG